MRIDATGILEMLISTIAKRAVEGLTNSDVSVRIQGLINKGNSELRKGHLFNAIDFFKSGLTPDTSVYETCIFNILLGYVYSLNGNLNKSFEYTRTAEQIAKNSNDIRAHIMVLTIKEFLYVYQGNFEKAISTFQAIPTLHAIF